MAAEVASKHDQASHELVRSLARLPTSDLVRFTLQKPDVARVFASSLNSLAVEAASSPLPANLDAHLARSHVDILARLIERGDPSLARKFVPTQGSLVDLAVATPSSSKTILSAVLERLLDTTSVNEILGGLSAQLHGGLGAETKQDTIVTTSVVRTLARLSSAFLSVCPARLVKENTSTLEAWAQTCFQLYDKVLPQAAKDCDGNATSNTFEPDLSQLDTSSWQLHWLTCRVDLLQLLSILLTNLKGSSAFANVLRDGLADTEKLLKKGGFSTLLNSTALLDLAATSDTWPSLRSELLSDPSAKKGRYEETLSSIDTLATSVPKFTGAAWVALQRFVASQSSSSPSSKRSGKAREQVPAADTGMVSEEVLASVDSILPHYGVDRLRTILSRPSFAGQDAEMVIERLLEGDEGEADVASAAAPTHSSAADTKPSISDQSAAFPSLPTATSAAPPSLVKSRANLFGDFAFDPSTIVQPKQSRLGKVDELAPELKAAILARAEAADEDEEAEEEWNPFASEPQRTVGVEDELDLDYWGNERERGAAPRRAPHDDDEDAHDDDNDGREAAGEEIDPAKMRERLLLRHYVQFGSHSFSSDAGTRRSDARKTLKSQTGWSDDLIESWAVMLDRNPRKDRLLAAASQSELDEQLASRDTRSNDADETAQSGEAASRRWGPDRGRGGRIMRGGGARGGGQRGAAGGAAGAGGGHQSKNATRGRGTGNSGTDRSAKQKERAGNKARQRGHDKKMAKVNGV